MREKLSSIIIFAVLGILFVFPVLYAQQEARDIFIREYLLGPRDLLQITVQDMPEFSKIEVRVSEDGSITLPLLQRVMVGGLNKDEVEQKLASLLEEKYLNLKKAQVSVFIKEYQSQQVAVIGAVDKPGMYEIIGRQNLMQMLSKAGGITEKAGNEIFVLREGKNGVSASIPIDLEDLFLNGNPKLNIPIQSNDVIMVQPDKIINVYVFGEVKQPGALQVKMSKKINLLQAIAQAGGLTESASKSGITITTKDKSGKEVKTKVNLKDIINGKKPNLLLKEGDVVYVPTSIF
jgi:polysaccharide export outer membrane protein